MDRVTKVFFDPLLHSKDEVESFVKTLPVGSAHSYQGELLVHSGNGGITTIDISMHAEDYFLNAISLGDLGEDTVARLKLFPAIAKFNDEYSIQQAPSSTFKIPIVDDLIHIFAVSVREPDYYDLCLGDYECRTACYAETETFQGLSHSGDVIARNFLLQHIKINSYYDVDKPIAVFVSGYQYHKLREYKQHNPLVVVANHETKALYIIPVPLDSASIGDATICCPLVIKRDTDDTLICSILSAPSIDTGKMCSGSTLRTDAFRTAIQRATFTIEPEHGQQQSSTPTDSASKMAPGDADVTAGTDVIIATHSVTLPSCIYRPKDTQIIRFGKGLHWMTGDNTARQEDGSLTVLPIMLGGVLEGPRVLAIGESPIKVPFRHMTELHRYYEEAKSILVIVDDKMSDNVRNLATTWRLNGVFIVQTGSPTPDEKADIPSLLDAVNINAVTCLAGPQSLILVQIGSKYYYYRGLADQKYLDTSKFSYGYDLTEFICDQEMTLSKLAHPDWPRLVDLSQKNPVYLPKMNHTMQLSELEDTFKKRSFAEIVVLKDDILGVVPQLQVLLPEGELQRFCSTLLSLVEEKVNMEVAPARDQYLAALQKHFKLGSDSELRKDKDTLLGNFRRKNKEVRENVKWLTQVLGNVVSTQNTSSRSHDLKRLIRQGVIKDNVSAAKEMSFQMLGELLDEHAGKMGALLVNIDTKKYYSYLKDALYSPDTPSCKDMCTLNPRTLHLDGLTSGILLEQTQQTHAANAGPLVSLKGIEQPILALANLDSGEQGSMLAWICWDEFVDLDNPYKVRWMEKCNDSHIAAARIIMRGTLSEAVSSRKVNLTPSSPATGQLMGALMMMAIQKLASTRSTPISTVSSDDTTTLLMRGLFGNLLSTAGSGSKPMSFVWQLFGVMPNFEVPSNPSDWSWYETAARYLPYTGWPMHQFKKNLTSLLDKMIFRMISRSEIKGAATAIKQTSLEEYCKARNIQLLHSRTIITILKKMLTQEEDCKDIAQRLLENVPENVEHQSESYRRLHRYIVHLASGGAKRPDDQLIAASVYAKRAAPFQEAKNEFLEAGWSKTGSNVNFEDGLATNNFQQGVKKGIISACERLFETRLSIEKEWGLAPNSIKPQNIKNIQKIYDFCKGSNDAFTKKEMESLLGDAEVIRVPWQIGTGKYGKIEELDMEFMNKILTGEEGTKVSQVQESKTAVVTTAEVFDGFKDLMRPGFLADVRGVNSIEKVCRMLNITPGAMETFAQTLSPGYDLEKKLPARFKEVMVVLLRDRSRDVEKIKATEMLFEVGK